MIRTIVWYAILAMFLSVCSADNGWTQYEQCDNQWGQQELGNCNQTICFSGAALASAAMMLNTKGVDVDPLSLNKYLTQNGGYDNNCDIVWSVTDSFGKTRFQGIKTVNESVICSAQEMGYGIIANIRSSRSKNHWVLLTRCEGNGVFNVNDPYWGVVSIYKISDIELEAVFNNS